MTKSLLVSMQDVLDIELLNYKSIDIEQPVVQTVAKRENIRSRRINKQKQSADPKTSQTGQTRDANQAQNSETIQAFDSEQAINTPPVVTDDGKPNIPLNATKQAAIISQPPNNENISSNADMYATPAAVSGMTYLAKKRSTTEILGDSMVNFDLI